MKVLLYAILHGHSFEQDASVRFKEKPKATVVSIISRVTQTSLISSVTTCQIRQLKISPKIQQDDEPENVLMEE